MRALLGCVLLAAMACKDSPKPPTATEPHRDEEEHGALPRQVRLDPNAVAEAGIRTEPVKRSALALTVALPGEVVSEPDRTARVSAATAGRLEQVTFNEGSVVKKGDVLATLRVPDVGRLRGAFAAAQAKSKATRANAVRLRSLKESGLGAEQAVVDAEAEANATEAEARALSEQLAAIGAQTSAEGGYLVPLRAPLAGVVVSRDAVVGQPIGSEHVLATIVDVSQVWFLGRVFEKDLGRLKPGARAEVRLNAFAAESFEGTVAYIGQATDPVARTLTARVELANPQGRIRLGLFGTAYVEAGEPGQAAALRVVVPRGAVTDVAGKRVVFVKAKDGDFVVHDVTLGDAALGRVQVLSGLDEGEEVAVSGVFTLKSLVLKSTLAEHE